MVENNVITSTVVAQIKSKLPPLSVDANWSGGLRPLTNGCTMQPMHSKHVLAEENEKRIRGARCATIGDEEFDTKNGLHHCDSHAGVGWGLKGP